MEEKKEVKKSSPKKTTTKKATTKKTVKKVEEITLKTDGLVEEVRVETEAEKSKKIEAQKEAFLYALKDKETIDTVHPKKEEPIEEIKLEAEEEIESKVTRYYDTPITEGLSNEIVEERKANGLVNIVDNEKGKSILNIVLSNIFTFFNMLYFAIAIILIIFKCYDNLGFLPLILANLAIGIFQEIRAKMTVEKMTLLSAPTATVIREGQKLEIPVSEIVLDDIILFTSGKQICSDSVVVEGSVEVNESLLTGESDAIVKNKGSQLLSGSFVVSGVCVARVDKIGNDNYIEKLSSDAKKYGAPKSELLLTLRRIIKIISIIIIPITGLYLFSSGVFTKDTPLDLAIPETAYIILAMIPAGLFLLTSLALFAGVIRLAKNKTLVQDLYCIEMLARVDVLCLDKTGTITDGTMRVCDCVEVKNYTDYTIREIVGSMMNALEDRNPTSDALVKYFDVNKVLTPINTIPFSSKRKFSAVTFEGEGTFILGAPEFVLKDAYDLVSTKVARFAKQGCRVLVLGHTNNKLKDNELPKTVKPLALIVIQDHIRDDASDTIEFFKNNGVDVKVISGDNPETVSEIAQRVGIENAERYVSLHGLSDDEVREIIFDYTVFGRVTPNQKKIIVQELKAHKKTVAMTGDGVNDILALKEADCSVAMASGSEATRHVSNLVLLDSNFSSMPDVVAEGRRVINNIQKSSSLFLMKTIYTILLSIFFLIVKDPYPFSPKQVLLLELFVIGIPSFFLALQPNNDPIKGKFLTNLLSKSLPGSLILFISVIGCYLFNLFLGTNGQYETMAALCVTFVGLLVLFRICKPFDVFRGIMFTAMVICCAVILSIESFFAFFEFTQLSLQNILFIICLVEISYPCYDVIVKTLDKVIYAKKE